jgi:hypothetical protein
MSSLRISSSINPRMRPGEPTPDSTLYTQVVDYSCCARCSSVTLLRISSATVGPSRLLQPTFVQICDEAKSPKISVMAIAPPTITAPRVLRSFGTTATAPNIAASTMRVDHADGGDHDEG